MGLIRFFTIITILRFLQLKSKHDSIICILLDIPCTTLRKPKKQTKVENVVIKPPPRKVIVEWILSASKSHSNLMLTTALDGNEDGQIHCFKPEENPLVAILGDIAEATPTEMLTDEDEEGDEEIDVFEIFLSEKCC